MRKDNLYVGKSEIEGRGLFTNLPIKKGQRAFILKVKKKKKINKTIRDVFANPNWIGFSKTLWTDPGVPFKYLNHSCDANVGFIGSVSFYAIKDIKAGEELTLDYSISEADTRWNLTCRCGNKKCRTIVTSIQSLPKKVFEHYLPYIPKKMQSIYMMYNKRNGKKK